MSGRKTLKVFRPPTDTYKGLGNGTKPTEYDDTKIVYRGMIRNDIHVYDAGDSIMLVDRMCDLLHTAEGKRWISYDTTPVSGGDLNKIRYYMQGGKLDEYQCEGDFAGIMYGEWSGKW